MKQKKSSNTQPSSHQVVKSVYAKLLRDVEGMSTKQRFTSMVSAGIYTTKGKLTAHYGG